MSVRRARRQKNDNERVLAALASEPDLSLFYLCRRSGLRAWRVTTALDRLMVSGRVTDSWDEALPSRRRYRLQVP